MSTLTLPPYPANPRQDAVDLYKAFKGFGCDKDAVIKILAHRDGTQRAFIQQEYKAMYSQELNSRLVSELSGNLEKAVLLWLLDPAGRDATVLRQALSGDVIDLKAATEVICSRTPSQIQTLKQVYRAKFGSNLENDIQRYTTDDHQKLLLAYIGIVRYEGPQFDPALAARDATELFKAGERRLGTDEKTFIRIFTEHSWSQLAAVASNYHQTYGKKLAMAVKKETSGYFEDGLLTILRCAQHPAKYFAKVLYQAMKGLGTNDTTLVRVITTRTEIDMQYIKAEYHKKYKKTLQEAILSETSGHYRTFLLSLVGPN